MRQLDMPSAVQQSRSQACADTGRTVCRLPIAPELTEEDQQSVENVAVIMEFLVGANGSDTFREVRPPASCAQQYALGISMQADGLNMAAPTAAL